MASRVSASVNQPTQAPDPVEWSLPFAKVKNGIADLWGVPTSPNWLLAEAEGQARAIAVLNLAVKCEKPANTARELGRIFGQIARHQFSKPLDPIQSEAIEAFWSLIGELAAAYTTSEDLGFAAKVVCRRVAASLASDTGYSEIRKRDQRARRAKLLRTKRRKTAKRGKAVRS